jgi:two-component system KDP operon response regulator KdpE
VSNGGGPSGNRLLLVEDEPRFRETLVLSLTARGYDVHAASDGEQGLQLMARIRPDLVILDLGLPGIDGVQVLRRLRTWSQVPVVVLSGRETEADKVAALDAGADDYVTKPFAIAELLARIRAALRRSPVDDHSPVIVTDDFRIDLAAQRVMRNGADVRLSPTQWHVVEVLARNHDRLVSQQQLLAEVWGPGHEDATNYLRVFMAQIRQKLEPEPARPRYFHTEPGRGYRFEPEGGHRATS